MAITEKYVTTTGTEAWATNSEANPSSITEAAANAAAGDRVNIKSGTYTLSAGLTIAGNGSTTQPIIWRGYNTTIGDLEGQGRSSDNQALDTTNYPVIACGASYYWYFDNKDYHVMQNLKITGSRNSFVCNASDTFLMVECSVTNSGTGASAVAWTDSVGDNTCVVACDFTCDGASGGLAAVNVTQAGATIYACRIKSQAAGILCSGGNSYGWRIVNNVLADPGGIGIDLSSVTSGLYPIFVAGNTIYGAGSDGIKTPNAAVTAAPILIDNHITDCGGYAINNGRSGTAVVPVITAYNRTRDNSSGAIGGYGDWELPINHVTDDFGAAATDYANAGSGDLELVLNAAGVGRSSMPYRDIGAVQHGGTLYGRATGAATLAKETGANAYGGSGSCIKLTADSTTRYGYVDLLVYVTGNAAQLSFRYKSFHTTTAWNGTLKVSWWDSDDPEEDPPPFEDGTDISGTYDATWRQKTMATARTPAAEGLCRIRFEILDGADSGGVYIDDIAITDT